MNQLTGRFCRGAAFAIAVVILATGCSTFRAGPGRTQTTFGYQGPVGGYVTATEVRSYDGDILQADLWSNTQQSGELLNLDVWPLVGIGIGAFGARAHIGSLGAGIGFLFYHPRSTRGVGRVEPVD